MDVTDSIGGIAAVKYATDSPGSENDAIFGALAASGRRAANIPCDSRLDQNSSLAYFLSFFSSPIQYSPSVRGTWAGYSSLLLLKVDCLENENREAFPAKGES